MQSRAADKLARVESFLSRLGERIIQLMQQYMTGEQVVRVVGSQAAPVWVTLRQGLHRRAVRLRGRGRIDPAAERDVPPPVGDAAGRRDGTARRAGVVDPAAVARHVLQFGFGMKSPEQFLAGPAGNAQRRASPVAHRVNRHLPPGGPHLVGQPPRNSRCQPKERMPPTRTPPGCATPAGGTMAAGWRHSS